MLQFLIIYIPLMASKMANDSGSSSNKEQNYNSLDQNNNTIIGISDDLNKLKTEVIALKMLVRDQLYLLKQSVGSTKAPEYNPSSDFYIKSLSEQKEYLKEENKIRNSMIQSLLYQNPFNGANSQMKDNNSNNSSSFSYSGNVVYPNVNNLKKNDDLITNDCIITTRIMQVMTIIITVIMIMLIIPTIKKRSVIITLSLKQKILPKGIKRSLSKITHLVSMLAVKKQRENQNLRPKLMILPVRTLK